MLGCGVSQVESHIPGLHSYAQQAHRLACELLRSQLLGSSLLRLHSQSHTLVVVMTGRLLLGNGWCSTIACIHKPCQLGAAEPEHVM